MFKQCDSISQETITIYLDGETLQVNTGLSVAAVLLSHSHHFNRTTPISGKKRAPFCMMGVCYDCLMIINGQPNQRSCSIQVQEGMVIEKQVGTGSMIGGIPYE